MSVDNWFRKVKFEILLINVLGFFNNIGFVVGVIGIGGLILFLLKRL